MAIDSWTKELPTKEGWYWIKGYLFDKPEPVYVVNLGSDQYPELFCHRIGGRVAGYKGCDFAGPIYYPPSM